MKPPLIKQHHSYTLKLRGSIALTPPPASQYNLVLPHYNIYTYIHTYIDVPSLLGENYNNNVVVAVLLMLPDGKQQGTNPPLFFPRSGQRGVKTPNGSVADLEHASEHFEKAESTSFRGLFWVNRCKRGPWSRGAKHSWPGNETCRFFKIRARK